MSSRLPYYRMGYSNHDKTEWVLIFALEFGRHFGLTLKQAFNYLSRFGGIASHAHLQHPLESGSLRRKRGWQLEPVAYPTTTARRGEV